MVLVHIKSAVRFRSAKLRGGKMVKMMLGVFRIRKCSFLKKISCRT